MATKGHWPGAQAGQIIDDDLNRLLVNPLPPGVRLHAIIDACHSGSVLVSTAPGTVLCSNLHCRGVLTT